MGEKIDRLPDLVKTIADERLEYPSAPGSGNILRCSQRFYWGSIQWMTHPVPAYLYVLEGALTVEFEDGRQYEFQEGEAFLRVEQYDIAAETSGTSRQNSWLSSVVWATFGAIYPPSAKEGAGARGRINSAEIVEQTLGEKCCWCLMKTMAVPGTFTAARWRHLPD